jgi:hypothetical protein
MNYAILITQQTSHIFSAKVYFSVILDEMRHQVFLGGSKSLRAIYLSVQILKSFNLRVLLRYRPNSLGGEQSSATVQNIPSRIQDHGSDKGLGALSQEDLSVALILKNPSPHSPDNCSPPLPIPLTLFTQTIASTNIGRNFRDTGSDEAPIARQREVKRRSISYFNLEVLLYGRKILW